MRLIDQASAALANLDADSLEELGRRAQALTALNFAVPGLADRATVPVLKARFRVFAGVLKATGENLATLERADAEDCSRSESFGWYGDRSVRGRKPSVRGLFESLGLYDDSDPGSSIWPRASTGELPAMKFGGRLA